MASLVQMLVAVELALLPAWVAAAWVRPPEAWASRALRTLLPAAVLELVILVLALLAGEGLWLGAIKAQVVAAALLTLLVGLASAFERVAGPRPAQVLTALAGWLVVGGIILAGPAVQLVGEPAKEIVIRAAAASNPLVAAETELGLKWLHQSLTYRLTPLGESYSYLLGGLAWWKTALGYVFVGSGLVVFSLPKWHRRRAGDGY